MITVAFGASPSGRAAAAHIAVPCGRRCRGARVRRQPVPGWHCSWHVWRHRLCSLGHFTQPMSQLVNNAQVRHTELVTYFCCCLRSSSRSHSRRSLSSLAFSLSKRKISLRAFSILSLSRRSSSFSLQKTIQVSLNLQRLSIVFYLSILICSSLCLLSNLLTSSSRRLACSLSSLSRSLNLWRSRACCKLIYFFLVPTLLILHKDKPLCWQRSIQWYWHSFWCAGLHLVSGSPFWAAVLPVADCECGFSFL